jgi:transcriptional regulator with XRE-family HTH domain
MSYDKKILSQVQNTWRTFKDATQASQLKAAKAMGMNQSAFSQYMRGEIPLNTDFLAKFGKLTRTPLEMFGIESATTRNSVQAITLPIKYTLSGKRLDNESTVIDTLVPPGETYGVRVDYSDHAFPCGSILIIDPSAPIKESDLVTYIRDGQPIVYGHITKGSDGWEILEQHYFGGRCYVVTEDDLVHRVQTCFLPVVGGKTFKE